MNVETTKLPGVLLLTPRVFADERGHFFEGWNEVALGKAGVRATFVQDNQSFSRRGVIRGLHYQIQNAQGKLVRALTGAVWDVVVDIRRGSPTFGQSLGAVLSAENKTMIWVPPGFAHGFLVVSDSADVLYKVTDFWAPQHERTIRWDDPTLAIDWPLEGREPVLSAKDRAGKSFEEAEVFLA